MGSFEFSHHNISARIDGDTMTLQQSAGGECCTIQLNPDQLLAIADKLRGATPHTIDAEGVRRLRVLHDRLSSVVSDRDFRTVLLDGRSAFDWLERLDCLCELSDEFAYGLVPDGGPVTDAATPQPNDARQSSLLGHGAV